MSSQKRTIMGACDYSIATLQNIKKDLSIFDHEHSELNWAIGGIVITLSSQLLRICGTVFNEAALAGTSSAKTDILEIQTRFNDFVSNMVNHE